MIPDSLTLKISNDILAAALQAETAEEGLIRIYTVIYTWTEAVSLDAVFAYNEARFDRQRSEETGRKIPAKDYLGLWTVAKLRAEPIHELNERLMEKEYQPLLAPLTGGTQETWSEADLIANGQALAGSLSIEQALDLFESLVVRYASLVDRQTVRQSMEPDRPAEDWTKEEAFRAVFRLLYYSIIDPMNAHGPWQVGVSVPADPAQRAKKKPSSSFYESDPPEVVFLRHLSPREIKAYREAAYALIHYRVVHERGMFEGIGMLYTLPQLPGFLNAFDTLSLDGDSDHWAQPVPGKDGSLRVTSLLLLAGIAAPAILIHANVDPLADTSPTGQAVMRMLEELLYESSDSRGQARVLIINLYQAAEKELKAHWQALEQVAKRLLEVGQLSKEQVYAMFEKPGRSLP